MSRIDVTYEVKSKNKVSTSYVIVVVIITHHHHHHHIIISDQRTTDHNSFTNDNYTASVGNSQTQN